MTSAIDIGFLASHRGSNVRTILDAINDKVLNAVPQIVISNNAFAGVLSFSSIQVVVTLSLIAQHQEIVVQVF